MISRYHPVIHPCSLGASELDAMRKQAELEGQAEAMAAIMQDQPIGRLRSGAKLLTQAMSPSSWPWARAR